MRHETDGYIKNKKEAIRSVRRAIYSKYAFTVFIFIWLPVWLFCLLINDQYGPKKWEQVEVTFSHFSEERIGLQRWHSKVINTKDGRKFVVPTKRISVEELEAVLSPGDVCTITHSKILSGGKPIETLSCKGMVLLSREDAESRWQKEHNEIILAIWITILLAVAALTLIDRLWCKPEYKRIKKLKADIDRRIRKRTKSQVDEETGNL